MKKLLLGFLILSNFSSFAGVGSKNDFIMIAGIGYNSGCEGIEAESKLMQIACNIGMSLKKAGLSEDNLEEVLTSLPEFESICE